MTTKPKARKVARKDTANPDPVSTAISEHKALLREYIRCRNELHAIR